MEKILTDKPLSVVTIFNKSKLPRTTDIDRIKALSQSLFIIGTHTIKNRGIEKKVKKHNLPNAKITSIPTGIGVSRFRRLIGKNEWNIELFGAAVRCTED